MNANTLKRLGKVYAGIALVSSVVSTIGYFNLRYSENKTRTKIQEVFDDIIPSVSTDLKLKQRPILKFDANGSGSLMYVTSTTNYQGVTIFSRKVISQETDYILHVNIEAMSKAITILNINTLRDLSNEFIKTVIRHECRHMQQFQNGFDVGKIENTISFNTSFIDGYGTDPKESDANIYAISASENKLERLVAEYNKATQDTAEKIMPDYSEVRKCIKALHRFSFAS